jgi:hypothetical protein
MSEKIAKKMRDRKVNKSTEHLSLLFDVQQPNSDKISADTPVMRVSMLRYESK